jgi:C4-dicarboxylate transporter, DctM subunit
MKSWDRLDKKLAGVEQILVAILLSAMIAVAFLQIVLRNFFATGIDWGDPLVRYLVVWVGFIGAAIATREGKHITIDVVSRWITGRGNRYIPVASHFSSALICGILTFAAIKFIRLETQIGGSVFLKLPVWVPELIIPAAFGLMTVRYAMRFLVVITRNSPHAITTRNTKTKMTFLLIVSLFVILLLIGVPIFVVIAGLTIYLFFSSQIDIAAVIIEMNRMATTPVLVAIPLFTFAGYLLSESGAPKRLIRLSNAVLGWMPGGLSVIALITCAVFTALTGATGLTIIALGGILLPAMLRGKYPEVFSLGLLTTSGTLGLLFPPSLPLILYAIVAGVRVDHLFIAGVLPGILLVVLLSAFSVFKSLRTAVPKSRFEILELLKAAREMVWELPLPWWCSGEFTAVTLPSAKPLPSRRCMFCWLK